LEAYQSLVEDVREHAVAAAFQDYRFPPVQASEVKDIEIEISYLTRPEPLKYENTEDLPKLIRPNVDGVVIKDGRQRATFLPQVWEKIPDPEAFLEELCVKMGATANLWRRKKLDVMIYQVEEFHE
jgi:AmmeMemoRadiSam system protein A